LSSGICVQVPSKAPKSLKHQHFIELAYNNRAVLHLLRGDSQAAMVDLREAQRVKPGTGVVQRNLDRASARMRVAASQD